MEEKSINKKVKLSDFVGIWSKETADNFEKNLEKIRARHREQRKIRIEKLMKKFPD